MSIKNDLPKNATTLPPLSQKEVDVAQAELKNGVNEKSSKIPIIPVPADAPSCNFAMPAFGGKPTRIYPYHQANKALVGYIARWDMTNRETGAHEKKILPICYCSLSNGKKAWRSAGIPSPRPPYRLPEILTRPDMPILVGEGEKTAEAAQILFQITL